MGNIFAEIPTSLPEEITTILAKSKGVQIERIISKGHVSSEEFWYDQETTEFVLLMQGEAKLELEGNEGEIVLGAGDYLVIPPHTRHKVVWTLPGEETIWLAVHF